MEEQIHNLQAQALVDHARRTNPDFDTLEPPKRGCCNLMSADRGMRYISTVNLLVFCSGLVYGVSFLQAQKESIIKGHHWDGDYRDMRNQAFWTIAKILLLFISAFFSARFLKLSLSEADRDAKSIEWKARLKL